MRAYAYDPSFTVTQAFTLCVEPNKRFSVAVFRTDGGAALTVVGALSLVGTANVQYLGKGPTGRYFFQAGGSTSQQLFNSDWSWPSVTLKFGQSAPKNTGAFAVVVYEVDANGRATDAIGAKIEAGTPIYPYPPDSDSMALLIGRPYLPANANIAYIVPLATYHAYNWTGGGCFYGYPGKGTQGSTLVTMRRPGGGLAADLGEPPDYYDTTSPRQQFAHWDAPFMRWMKAQGIGCDVYCDLDLHVGAPALDLSLYKLVVSVGHHEYWSQQMRDNLNTFLANGGNYACFSGNTCFRPVNFGAYRTSGFMNSVQKLANYWSDPIYNESQIIGLSYGWGGGKWGNWNGSTWDDLQRTNYGYTVTQSSHWVFQGTGLTNGQTFGNGSGDFLVGYEADGVPPTGGLTVLAQSPYLNGFVPGNEGGGQTVLTASLGIMGPDSGGPEKSRMVFNAGTTDWARVLTSSAAASRSVVAQITKNVLNTLSYRPD